MSLIDPPRFVSVPSWMIFGIEDLERELYRALLQVVGWLWVTKKHGGDLVTGIGELGERWGVAERTVYDRLKTYRDRGYLVVRYGQGGRVYIQLQQTGSAVRSAGRRGTTEDGELCGQAARDGAGAGRPHEMGVGVNSEVCGGSILIDPPVGDTTTTGGGGAKRGDGGGQVGSRLLEVGVHPGRAEALGRDPWVTMERVEGWIEDLMGQGSRIGSVPAVLAKNLGDHWLPPGLRGMAAKGSGSRERRRYVEGEFGEFVER